MDDLKFSARSHYDFIGLGELKARADNEDMKAAKEVGSQFEALFVQMMLKSMRDAAAPLKSGLLDSSATNTFEEMYHGELSQAIAKRSSLGIGDWILENMRRNSGTLESELKNIKAENKNRYETRHEKNNNSSVNLDI
tara:strand:+ start:33 stop:446 length:414 start_codon:yes stop_codon:yes gene_type:complete